MTIKQNWNREVGWRGEDLAERFFLDRDFTVLKRNYRTPYGEIDLIVEKNREIKFVEVKTRTSLVFGFGENAVDNGKLEHMIAAAEHYMSVEELDTDTWQIDVLAIQFNETGQEPDFEWFENVA